MQVASQVTDRFKTLRNKEILRKSQIQVETFDSQQHSKNTKKQISNFSFHVQFYWISIFCFKYFAQDYLANKVQVLTQTSLLQTLYFWYFVCYQRMSFNVLLLGKTNMLLFLTLRMQISIQKQVKDRIVLSKGDSPCLLGYN